MMTFGRLFRVMAVAGLTMLLIPVAALAQSPTWTVSSADASAGSDVVLNISLSDTTGIAGANLTVKLDNNDILTFKKFDGVNVSEKTAATTSWQKDENLVSATELRIVLYDSNTPPQAMGAGTDVPMVTIHLSVDPAAQVDATAAVNLDAGVDGSVTPNVGLTRLSDANGTSITPGVVNGVVTVVAPAFPPTAFDFSGGQLDWTIIQVRETFDSGGSPAIKASDPGSAIGLKVTKTNDTFGFYSSPDGAIPAASQDNILLQAKWNISSSEADPANAPAFRLRFNASDATVAELLEIQSTSENLAGGRLSPGTTPRDYYEYFMEAPTARNATGTAGYLAAFDMEAFDPRFTGSLDSVIWLHSLQVTGASVDTSSPTPVSGFNYDFSASGTDSLGWLGVVPQPLAGLDGTTFDNTIVTEVNNGLILRSVNTPHNAPDYKFSFGIWLSPQVTLTGSATSLYRLKVTIASMTADPVQTPHFRIRINSSDAQWTRHYEVIRKDIDPGMAPSASGTDYFVYFNYPAEMNDVPVTVSVDQINDRPEDDVNGAFKVTGAVIEQIPMPTYQ